MECFVSGDTYYESRASTPSSTTIYTDRRITQCLSSGAPSPRRPGRADQAFARSSRRPGSAKRIARGTRQLSSALLENNAPPNWDNGNKPILIWLAVAGWPPRPSARCKPNFSKHLPRKSALITSRFWTANSCSTNLSIGLARAWPI